VAAQRAPFSGASRARTSIAERAGSGRRNGAACAPMSLPLRNFVFPMGERKNLVHGVIGDDMPKLQSAGPASHGMKLKLHLEAVSLLHLQGAWSPLQAEQASASPTSTTAKRLQDNGQSSTTYNTILRTSNERTRTRTQYLQGTSMPTGTSTTHQTKQHSWRTSP
jgi:hypothetical protein